MRTKIPPECTADSNHAEIVCAEKGRKIKFLNPQKRNVLRHAVDSCTNLRAILENPNCKLCDFIVVDWRSNEHLVELKGANVEHALKQLESTMEKVVGMSAKNCIYCWIITTESPATQSKFQVLKTRFEKRFKTKLKIKTNQHTHCLEKNSL